MSIIPVQNLNFIRQIPLIGARIYEAFSSLQQGVTAMAVQANLNPTGQVDPPPTIQSVKAVGQNGVLHVSIEHTAAGVKRGVRYYVEHADNPSFTNPQIRQIGDSRSFTEFVGAQSRYVRAYAAYPGSAAGAKVYHGGAATPQPVDAGGAIGPAAYLPSQGAGTGAPGQGGMGPGPVQVRTDVSGFDWKLQWPVVTGGFGPGNSPASLNGIGSASGDSGGGGLVVQPNLFDTYANWTVTKYSPTQYPINTTFTITDRGFVSYIVRSVTGVNKWVYLSGQYDAVLASIPTTGYNGVALGTNDTGLPFGVTDYSHVLRWGGAAWAFNPGDGGSGFLAQFEVDPGTGWHLYDGSTVNYLKADGTTGSVTLPNLAGTAAYLKAGGSNSGPNVAVDGVVAVSGAAALGGSATVTGTTGADSGAGQIVQSGTGVTVAAHTHDHGATLSGSAAVSGTVSLPGTSTGAEPPNLVRRPFFRQ